MRVVWRKGGWDLKTARRSFGPSYECQKPWPEDCFVQCGDHGIVLPAKTLEKVMEGNEDCIPIIKSALIGDPAPVPEGAYRTAFFEAFPRTPDTFIRGEGKDVQEAEKKAWEEFEKYNACKGHEYEKRGYTNGAGFCKHCGMFKSKIFSGK